MAEPCWGCIRSLRNRLILMGLIAVFLTLAVGCSLNRNQEADLVRSITGHPAYPTVAYLANLGIIRGYDDGSFKPDNPITRAEFIAMVNRGFGFDQEAPMPYSDVAAGAWYYQEIALAAAAGYLPDWPDGRMAPDSQLTREDAAFIMAKVLALGDQDANRIIFSDADSVTGSRQGAAAQMVQTGLMQVYPDQTFRPGETLSRAEAAVLVRKGLKIYPPSAGMVNVEDFGALGDGRTDDTASIQRAIDQVSDQGGGTVYLPGGIYLVDAEKSIVLPSHIKLMLAHDAVLQAKATKKEHYAVVLIYDSEDVSVCGGSIIGERYDHIGTSGEWGMGISILGSNNVHIADLSVSDCWGDGIYIGSSSSQNYCENVLVEKFTLNNNRRQGISIISAKQMTVRDGVITNTSGVDPQAGLNLEPNSPTEFAQSVLVEDILTAANSGYGILVALGPYKDSPYTVSLTIRKHTDVDSTKGAVSDYRYFERNPGYQVQFDIE